MAPKLCHTRELKSCKEESFGKGTQEQVAESADGNEEQPGEMSSSSDASKLCKFAAKEVSFWSFWGKKNWCCVCSKDR